MKRKAVITLLLIFCFLLCYEMTTDVSGKWNGNLVKVDNTNYPLTYNVIVNENQITGTAQAVTGTFFYRFSDD